MPSLSVHSPLGPLTITEEDGRITSLGWGWRENAEETGLLAIAREQLIEYFDGEREHFELPLAPGGTEFQKKVWAAMCRIPHGEVKSYGDLAGELGSAPRAVGGACARNPIPIFIPCHRVVGADGALTGYSGADGLATKDYLLDHERGAPAQQRLAV
jgi:methylated-DNA-[protein]-cysteine S-methyltransferase